MHSYLLMTEINTGALARVNTGFPTAFTNTLPDTSGLKTHWWKTSCKVWLVHT